MMEKGGYISRDGNKLADDSSDSGVDKDLNPEKQENNSEMARRNVGRTRRPKHKSINVGKKKGRKKSSFWERLARW
jgi:hypothetical protein